MRVRWSRMTSKLPDLEVRRQRVGLFATKARLDARFKRVENVPQVWVQFRAGRPQEHVVHVVPHRHQKRLEAATRARDGGGVSRIRIRRWFRTALHGDNDGRPCRRTTRPRDRRQPNGRDQPLGSNPVEVEHPETERRELVGPSTGVWRQDVPGRRGRLKQQHAEPAGAMDQTVDHVKQRSAGRDQHVAVTDRGRVDELGLVLGEIGEHKVMAARRIARPGQRVPDVGPTFGHSIGSQSTHQRPVSMGTKQNTRRVGWGGADTLSRKGRLLESER